MLGSGLLTHIWAHIPFSRDKIYKKKKIIMCKKKNSYYKLIFIHKFFMLIGLLFEFQIIFKNY